MSPIIGVIDSAKTGRLSSSAYVSLATATVTSTGTNSITFSGIPTTGYKHLELVVYGRTTNSGTGCDEVQMRVGNGSIDSAGNYSYAFIYGTSTNTARANTGTGQTYMRMGFVSRGGYNAALYAPNIIQIADYASSKIKVIQMIGGVSTNDSTGLVANAQGLWNSGQPITNIELKTELNWVAGSTATLYGLKDS